MSSPQHADGPAQKETAVQNPDSLEVAPGRARETVEGWVPQLATEEELREALEKAFDYRGDVTVTAKDGKKLEGYIFDRVSGPTLATSFVRLLPKTEDRLCRYRGARLLRPRPRSRKKLGSLGAQVLGKEGLRRGWTQSPTRVPRIAFFCA